MGWIGYDEKYLDRPFTGSVVSAVVGRPLAINNRDTASDFLFRNAEGYDPRGMPPKAKMKKAPVSEPLPPGIIAQIRAANKKAGRRSID